MRGDRMAILFVMSQRRGRWKLSECLIKAVELSPDLVRSWGAVKGLF